MRVITVAGPKGGVGKTTTACGLAWALNLRHTGRVGFVDVDPQATGCQWYGPDAVRCDPATGDELVEAAAHLDVDWLVVDTPPGRDPAAIAALEAADLVVAVTRLGAGDFEALAAMVRNVVDPDLVVATHATRLATHLEQLDLLRSTFGKKLAAVVPLAIGTVERAQRAERPIPWSSPVGAAYTSLAAAVLGVARKRGR